MVGPNVLPEAWSRCPLCLELLERLLPPVVGNRLCIFRGEEVLELVKLARLERVSGAEANADQVDELVEVQKLKRRCAGNLKGRAAKRTQALPRFPARDSA
jgi:hypothetical protein